MKHFLLLLMSLCLVACQAEDTAVHGYVEGEFIRISPTSAGLLEDLSVERGQSVQAGDALFSLDRITLTAKRDSAALEVRQAQAMLDDLLKGERPEEIEVILKQREQAKATLINARKEYNRILPLSKTGAASVSSRDDAKAALDTANARMDELDARLKTANLGARIDQIEAAQASVDIANQELAQAEKTLQEAAPFAPAAGIVDDTYFRPGEYVAAGQPVVSLLPPDNVKIRFYVPQATLPLIQPGHNVRISCDGCGQQIAAKISYIAPESEYTPPVIFSVRSRDKLVFLIEAKPEGFHSELRPGLPVDIDLGL